jgi:predicted  nucleic acid-binding Zn-ribbon protein
MAVHIFFLTITTKRYLQKLEGLWRLNCDRDEAVARTVALSAEIDNVRKLTMQMSQTLRAVETQREQAERRLHAEKQDLEKWLDQASREITAAADLRWQELESTFRELRRQLLLKEERIQQSARPGPYDSDPQVYK